MSEKPSKQASLSAEELKVLADKVSTLLALARQILKSKGEAIIEIEEYSQILAQIEPNIKTSLSNSEIRAALKQLESLHADVMAKVQSDKDKIRVEIASLKKKGKVLITYTDQLPKRISLGTRRKI